MKHKCYSRREECRSPRVRPLHSEIPTLSFPKHEILHSYLHFRRQLGLRESHVLHGLFARFSSRLRRCTAWAEDRACSVHPRCPSKGDRKPKGFSCVSRDTSGAA